MVSENSQLVERRSQSHRLIEQLVAQRTEMLSLYNQLASIRPYDKDDQDIKDLLEEFCEILVDYTANAHFRLYRFIDEGIEKRRAVLDLADEIYPRIVKTTEAIIAFNDQLDGGDDGQIADLEHALSHLGEELADRIELEDQMIEVMSVSRSEPEGRRLHS
jgi:regulator of sigma D